MISPTLARPSGMPVTGEKPMVQMGFTEVGTAEAYEGGHLQRGVAPSTACGGLWVVDAGNRYQP